MSQSTPLSLETMKNKILHYHQANQSPAALRVLLDNLKQSYITQVDNKNFSFPKIEDSFTYKNKVTNPFLTVHLMKKIRSKSLFQNHMQSQITTLNNSITSTINQSDLNLSIQNSQEHLLEQVQKIQKEGELSPSSNKNIQYLEEIESSEEKFQKKFKTLMKNSFPAMKIENHEIQTDFETISQQQEQNAHLSVRNFELSDEKRKSSITEIQSVQRQKIYQIERFGDLNKIIESCPERVLPIINYFKQNEVQINQTIRKKDLNQMINQLRTPLEICEQIQELPFFTNLVKFLGDFAFDVDEYHTAVFFLNQCYIISEVTKNYMMKIKSLIRLSDCARKLKLYQQSIEFLKKALIYTWFSNDKENEILCYDLIGLGYFYLGNLKSALFFHEKWSYAEIEPLNGYFRNTAKKFIEFYEQKIPYIFSSINKAFMDKLSLPIRNLFELNNNEETEQNYCDKYKVIRFNNCNGMQIVEEILNGLEFTDYKIEYYEIQKRTRQIEIPNKQTLVKKTKRVHFPWIITQIKQKYNKNQQQYSFNHEIYDNPQYNVPLEQKIQHRIKKQVDLNQIWERVERQIGETRQPYGICQEQIYMKHVDQKRSFMRKNELFVKRMNTYITSLLENLAGQNQ